MARMIPDICQSNSPGEKRLFPLLKNSPHTKDWIVLHSFHTANHPKKIEGEIDFLIIIPGQGVLCLEVKGGYIERKEGIWISQGGRKKSPESPFEQVSEAMHSVVRFVKTRGEKDLGQLVYFSAVVFMAQEFEIESSEWQEWQSLDRYDLAHSDLGVLLASVLKKAHRHISSKSTSDYWYHEKNSRPTKEQSARLAELLRPNVEFFTPRKSWAEENRKKILEYTENQYLALDAMSENPRVVFKGLAGTGKTVLAEEAYARARLEDLTVGLFCFNNLLGEELRRSTDSLSKSANSYVGTIHKFMLNSIQANDIEAANPEFWQTTLPEEVFQRYCDSEAELMEFDLILVDESQDIVTNHAYLDVLDIVLRGGLRSGRWMFFGDFDRQLIYGGMPQDPLKELGSRCDSYVSFILTDNCRNTMAIAKSVEMICNLNPTYKKILHDQQDPQVQIETFSGAEEQLDILEQLIKDASRIFSRDEIVILSPKKNEDCCAEQLAGDKPGLKLRRLNEFVGSRSVGYGTIHAFKGLEAPFVIVTDVDELESRQMKNLLYVGLSRAQVELVVLINNKAKDAYQKMLVEGFKQSSKEG